MLSGTCPGECIFCKFYRTKEDLLDARFPYFKAELENNELCVWVTSQVLDIEESKEALRSIVPEIAIYTEKGQTDIFPYIVWYEGIFDPEY